MAGLARKTGVSRAAVTRWFRKAKKEGWVNVESKTLVALARGLGLSPDELLTERISLDSFETSFLWDHLYPDMESFVQALVQHQRPAMARLVQTVGFRSAIKILGGVILRRFEEYEKQIPPVRRQELERVWPLYQRST